jgi:endoglucanase
MHGTLFKFTFIVTQAKNDIILLLVRSHYFKNQFTMILWQMCLGLPILILCCSSWELRAQGIDTNVVQDSHGAIIRGDLSKRRIALVFTGDEFADGGEIIKNTLKKNDVKASFFLTGKFYRNKNFKTLIRDLQKDGHYLGAHSDKHLLYADWIKRDSLLVSEKKFHRDIENNYRSMKKFNIEKSAASFFLPPFEWYNSAISQWVQDAGLQLVNFSPGTLSAADYTYPEMGKRYRSSEMIYQSIMEYEETNAHGLNGFILLLHIGTDPRRTDKFYHSLDELIIVLQRKGYIFSRIDSLLL